MKSDDDISAKVYVPPFVKMADCFPSIVEESSVSTVADVVPEAKPSPPKVKFALGMRETAEIARDLNAAFGIAPEITHMIVKMNYDEEIKFFKARHKQKFKLVLLRVLNIGKIMEMTEMKRPRLRRINGELYLFREEVPEDAPKDEEKRLLKDWKHLFTQEKKVQHYSLDVLLTQIHVNEPPSIYRYYNTSFKKFFVRFYTHNLGSDFRKMYPPRRNRHEFPRLRRVTNPLRREGFTGFMPIYAEFF